MRIRIPNKENQRKEREGPGISLPRARNRTRSQDLQRNESVIRVHKQQAPVQPGGRPSEKLIRPGPEAWITGELPAPEERTRRAGIGAAVGGAAGVVGGIAAGVALAGSIGIVPAILAGVGIAAAGTLLGLGIGALVSGGSAAAQRNAGIVKVTPEIPATKYDHNLSGAEIRALSASNRRADSAGHTRGSLFGRLEMTTAFNLGRKQDGKFAYWVHNLEFKYGYRDITVWIAKEYREGSCEYGVTLDHENEHVALDQRLVREYQEKIRQAILKFTPLPTEAKPLWVATEAEGDAATDAIKVSVAEGAVAPLFEQLKEDLHRGNDDLDAPENYSKVYDRCSNW